MFAFAMGPQCDGQEKREEKEPIQEQVAGQPPRKKTSSELVNEQIRGLFQNELDVVEAVCNPTEPQAKELLRIAESEWESKTRREFAKRLQQHVYGTVDFDGQIERTMQEWTAKVLTAEQSALYTAELLDRAEYRKQAVINRMLIWLQMKLQLSSSQLDQIEKILHDRWRDRWYRSIEATFDNETLLPELNRSWLDTVLTDSQRNALATRAPSTTVIPSQQHHFPSLPLSKPFTLGGFFSSLPDQPNEVPEKDATQTRDSESDTRK